MQDRWLRVAAFTLPPVCSTVKLCLDCFCVSTCLCLVSDPLPVAARSSDEPFHIHSLRNLEQNTTIHDDYYTIPFGFLMHSCCESAVHLGKSLLSPRRPEHLPPASHQ